MEKIKIGIIGTGVGIRTHLKGFRLFENEAEVYAIAGSRPERSKEFAQAHGIPVACDDYKALCDMDEIDLVCITAPNKFHKEMLKYAISKKKNIICEKPMVDTPEEVEEILAIAEGYDKLLVIDHQLRFNPYIKEIKRLIDDGILGKVYNVRLNQQGTGFANANAPWIWSYDGKEGGGVRLAMASHFTDLIQYWFDSREVVSVLATLNPITKQRLNGGVATEVTASTTCNAFITLKDELTVQYSINAGSYMGSRFDITIFGDKGELTFSLQDKLKLYLRDEVGKCQVVTPAGVYQDEAENKVSIFSGSFRYFAPKIIEAVKTADKAPVITAATATDARYCIGVLDAIKKSANGGIGISFGKETNEYV